MQDDVDVKSTVKKVIRIEKTRVGKLKKVFYADYHEILEETVLRAHKIFGLSSQLLKLLFIRDFENLNTTHSDIRDVFAEFSKKHNLSLDTFYNALIAVSSEKDKKKGRSFKSGSQVNDLYSLYDEYKEIGVFPKEKLLGSNMSHIFKYFKIQLHTAYKNNIILHFEKYIKRLTKYLMRQHFLRQKNRSSWMDLPIAERDEHNKLIGKVITYLLSDKEDSKISSTTNKCSEVKKSKKSPHRKSKKKSDKKTGKNQSSKDTARNDDQGGKPKSDNPLDKLPLEWHSFVKDLTDRYSLQSNWRSKLETSPHLYLPYMIHMNKILEEADVKQFSPLPFRHDFTPKSMTIDTTALIDLLINASNVKKLNDHLRSCGWLLKNDLTKKDLYDTPTKYENIHTYTDDLKKVTFKTDVWKFFTKPNLHDRYKNLIFNNMISTNGYQISIHYVDAETYVRERFQKGVKVLQPTTDPFTYIQNLEAEERERISNRDKTILLANDPGKNSICTLSLGCLDEGEKSPVVTYTKVQRRKEMSYYRNRAEMLRQFNKSCGDGRTYKELIQTVKTSGKSSNLETFVRYLLERRETEDVLQELFQQTSFRRRQYRSYLGKQSSTDKLKDRIRKTFNPEPDSGKEIVIAWGNWGRNPNLRHQPPTPGIGLRRIVDQSFRTLTCDERGTSSECPKCEGDLEYPLTRIQKEIDELNGKITYVSKHVHHVLRCKNVSCRMWWNRDILGACNIKRQADYCLKNGKIDEHFLKTVRPDKPKSVAKG